MLEDQVTGTNEVGSRSHSHDLVRKIVLEFVDPQSGFLSNAFQYMAEVERIGVQAARSIAIDMLENASPQTRLGAAGLLLFAGGATLRAGQVLAEALDGDDDDHRVWTLLLLSQFNLPPEETRESLERVFEEGEESLRVYAAAALAESKVEAVYVLGSALKSGHPPLVMVAASAFGRMGLKSRDAVSMLIDALTDLPSELKHSVICLLSNIGEAAAPAIPAFIKLLNAPDTDMPTRRAIAMCLGKVTPKKESRRISQSLLASVRSTDLALACAAAESLRLLNVENAAAIAGLIEWLGDADGKTRLVVARQLGEFGPLLAEYVFDLWRLAEQEVVPDVLRTLANTMASGGPDAIRRIMENVDVSDENALYMVSGIIARMRPDDLEEVTATVMGYPDSRIRQVITDAVVGLGPRANSVVPVLVSLLRSRDCNLRVDALKALRAVGPDAAVACPDIVRFLGDDSDYLREWAASALRAIGPASVRALEAAYPDADKQTCKRIDTLLSELGSSIGHGTAGELAWVGDDILLRLFRAVGEVLRERGPVSYRELSRTLETLQLEGRVSRDLDVVESTIRKKIEKLESLVSKKEGRPVKLKASSSTRKGGLTTEGDDFLRKVIQYLNSLDDQR